MQTLCNRFNPQRVIAILQLCHCPSMGYAKRWQVSIQDTCGQSYDFYFQAKPTRKQVRKLHNKVREFIHESSGNVQ